MKAMDDRPIHIAELSEQIRKLNQLIELHH